jgi:hypothetical protein
MILLRDAAAIVIMRLYIARLLRMMTGALGLPRSRVRDLARSALDDDEADDLHRGEGESAGP